MTLREFTKQHMEPYPDAVSDYWRLVFPHKLRFHNEVIEAGYYKGRWLFNSWVDPVKVKKLEERWERVHAGEIIDTEWRKVQEY